MLIFHLGLENTAKRINLIVYFGKDVNISYDQLLANKNWERHKAILLMIEATLCSYWISVAAEFNCIMVVQKCLLVQLWHSCCTELQRGVCSCPGAGEEHWLCLCSVIHISPGFLETDYPESGVFLVFNEIGKKGSKNILHFFPFSFSFSFHCVLTGHVFVCTLLQFHFLTYITNEQEKLHPILWAQHRNTDSSHYLLVVYSNDTKIY